MKQTIDLPSMERISETQKEGAFPLSAARASELISDWGRLLQQNGPVLKQIEERYGVNPDTLARFGCGYQKWHDKDLLTIPARLADGLISFKMFRPKFARAEGESKSFWYPSLGGRPAPLFNIEALANSNGRPVLFVGGELKTMSSAQRGLLAVGTTRGEAAKLSPHIEAFRDKVIVLCMDNDEAGRKASQERFAELEKVAARVALFPWAGLEHKALDDCFVAGVEVDEIQRRVARSFDLPTWQVLEHGTPIPRPEHVLPGLLSAGQIGLVVGSPGAGKTLLLIDLAVRLVRGESWLCDPLNGLPYVRIEKPIPVLFVDLERGAYQADLRARQLGWKGEKEFSYIVHRSHFLGLDREGGAKELERMVETRSVRPKLVILDSLSRLHSADENSNADMTQVMTHFRQVADKLGVALLASHHTPKPQPDNRARSHNPSVFGARGAGAIAACVDEQWSYVQKAEDRQLHHVRSMGIGGTRSPIGVVLEHDENGETVRLVSASPQDGPESQAARFRRFLTGAWRNEKWPPQSREDLEQRFKEATGEVVQPRTVQRVLKQLRNEGHVDIDPKGPECLYKWK